MSRLKTDLALIGTPHWAVLPSGSQEHRGTAVAIADGLGTPRVIRVVRHESEDENTTRERAEALCRVLNEDPRAPERVPPRPDFRPELPREPTGQEPVHEDAALLEDEDGDGEVDEDENWDEPELLEEPVAPPRGRKPRPPQEVPPLEEEPPEPHVTPWPWQKKPKK